MISVIVNDAKLTWNQCFCKSFCGFGKNNYMYEQCVNPISVIQPISMTSLTGFNLLTNFSKTISRFCSGERSDL